MNAKELEAFLRAIPAFRGVNVQPMSALAPWHVILSGTVMLYGDPHFYEAELNLNEFNSMEDINKLVVSLFASFEKAEKGLTDD